MFSSVLETRVLRGGGNSGLTERTEPRENAGTRLAYRPSIQLGCHPSDLLPR